MMAASTPSSSAVPSSVASSVPVAPPIAAVETLAPSTTATAQSSSSSTSSTTVTSTTPITTTGAVAWHEISNGSTGDNHPSLSYEFDEQLCRRMCDEAHVYIAGIRTRIDTLGARFNVANKEQLQRAMDHLLQHARSFAAADSSSATTTTPTTETKSPSTTTLMMDRRRAWQATHEQLRDQLFAEMREASLKSSVDNALFMGLFKTAQMVVPGIYIGSQSFVKSMKSLDEWGITHVVSCNNTSPLYGGRYGWCTLAMDDIQTQQLQPHVDHALAFITAARLGRDTSTMKGTAVTKETKTVTVARPSSAGGTPTPAAVALTPLQRAERDGRGRVLIHCSAGISRSAAICIAWIMRHGYSHTSSAAVIPPPLPPPVSFEACVRLMEATRPVVNPNPSFRQQLQDLYRTWHKSSTTATATVRTPAAVAPVTVTVTGTVAAVTAPSVVETTTTTPQVAIPAVQYPVLSRDSS